MLSGPLTDAELREVFEEILAGYAAGEDTPIISCYGIDADPVLEALGRVRRAAPNPPAELLEAARTVLERELHRKLY